MDNLQNYLEFAQDPANALGLCLAIGFFAGFIFASFGYVGIELSEILHLKITDMRERRKKRIEKERSNHYEN